MLFNVQITIAFRLIALNPFLNLLYMSRPSLFILPTYLHSLVSTSNSHVVLLCTLAKYRDKKVDLEKLQKKQMWMHKCRMYLEWEHFLKVVLSVKGHNGNKEEVKCILVFCILNILSVGVNVHTQFILLPIVYSYSLVCLHQQPVK